MKRKPLGVNINVRVDPALARALTRKAEAAGAESLSQYVRTILKRAVRRK